MSSSAVFEMGNTKVIAAVYVPREVLFHSFSKFLMYLSVCLIVCLFAHSDSEQEPTKEWSCIGVYMFVCIILGLMLYKFEMLVPFSL